MEYWWVYGVVNFIYSVYIAYIETRNKVICLR